MSGTFGTDLRLGTSGWAYDDWVGSFYPAGTSKRDMLARYAEHLSTVEIDSTWYGTPRASTVKRWAEATPDGFIFAAKVPQEITHAEKKPLSEVGPDLARFVTAMEPLGDKLGPLLLQFPYGLRPADRFDDLTAFLAMLPGDFAWALEIRNRQWLGRSSLWPSWMCCVGTW